MRAAFLDRDGTLIRDAHHLNRPEQLELFPQTLEALRQLRAAGYLLLLITNQSAVARGMLTREGLDHIHQRFQQMLGECALDAIYYCPHHPDFTEVCDCRKPKAGLFEQAAAEHGIDFSNSVAIGDKLSDLSAPVERGSRGFLVRTGYGAAQEKLAAPEITVVDHIGAAVSALLNDRHQA